MPTAFETEMLSSFPDVCFFFAEASGNLLNSGAFSSQHFTNHTDISYQAAGPTATPFAILGDTSGVLEPEVKNASDWFASSTTGTIACAFKQDGTEPVGIIFYIGENAQGNPKHMWLHMNNGGSLYWKLSTANSNVAQYSTTVSGFDDDVWHLVVMRQKADGTGVECFVDTRTDIQGTYTEIVDSKDDWQLALGGSTDIDSTSLFFSPAANDRHADGSIAAFGMTGSAMSDADIDDLFTAWGGAGGGGGTDFTSKTIRRIGRRLFPNYI